MRAEPVLPPRPSSGRRHRWRILALVVVLSVGGCGPAVPAAAPPAPADPLAGRVIVVDPGHNGGNAAHPEQVKPLVDAYTHRKPCNTTGTATADGYPEHAFNWDVAQRLAALLRAYGATVVLTRSDDRGVGPCVDERAAIANRHRAALAVSIHADDAPADGHGFHVLEPARIPGAPSAATVESSHRLALVTRDQLRTVLPPATYIGQGGINTRSDMAALNLAQVPAVMVECGNMRNPGDAERMKSAAFRQRLAQALADSVNVFLTQ